MMSLCMSYDVIMYVILCHMMSLCMSYDVIVFTQPNHTQLLLQGCDRVYLNSTTTNNDMSSHPVGVAGGVAGRSHLSSPQWKILPIPSSYLVLNWPIKVRTP